MPQLGDVPVRIIGAGAWTCAISAIVGCVPECFVKMQPHRALPTTASPHRAALVERWYDLTRDILPAMAAEQRWPIRLDHCFMRVCLDEVFGPPWTTSIGRPAIRTMDDDQLRLAIAVAEGLVARPETLPPLNDKSLRGRRDARRTTGT